MSNEYREFSILAAKARLSPASGASSATWLTVDQFLKGLPCDGGLSRVIDAITQATTAIGEEVRFGGLRGRHGNAGFANVHGESVQKLDVYSNDLLAMFLQSCKSVAVVGSEENEVPLILDCEPGNRRYVVLLDPLDGSSNIEVGITIGTVFSVLEYQPQLKPGAAVLQPGGRQIAAGYVIYGSCSVMVLTTGQGVFGFTQDPVSRRFILSHPNIRIPRQGAVYSVNEANSDDFPAVYRGYLNQLRQGIAGRRYKSRYVGSLVADYHRTLLKGGVFLYPPTTDHPSGKLRLLYEANPLAFIAEQAGGKASSGWQRILSMQPLHAHETTPFVVGGPVEMAEFERYCEQRSKSRKSKSGTAFDLIA